MAEDEEPGGTERASQAAAAAVDGSLTVATGVELLSPAAALLGPPARFLADVLIKPSEADARMAAAEPMAAIESRMDTVEGRVHVLFEASVLRSQAERADTFREVMADVHRKEELKITARKLLASAELTSEEVVAAPLLADAIYRCFRDALDAVAPEAVPAFVRLATIYQAQPFTRIGRSIAEFLRQIETAEWRTLRGFVDEMSGFFGHIDEIRSSDPHVFRVTATGSGASVRVVAGRLTNRVGTVRDGGALSMLRLFVRYEIAFAEKPWHETDVAKMRGDVARVLHYSVTGEGPPPAAPR